MKHPGVANTIDRALLLAQGNNRQRVEPEVKAARAHRRGFNSGLAGEPADPIGVGAAQIPDFDAGVQAGLDARREYTGGIPARQLPNGRFGLPKPNPAFKFVADNLYAKVAR